MTKIKICGLFRDEDILAVNEYVPDMIGFVFAPSRRQVQREQAVRWSRMVRRDIQKVGVFVNAPLEEITRIAADCRLEWIQLHGSESDDVVRQVQRRTGLSVIQAMTVERWKARNGVDSPAEMVLLDQGKGGTGRAFDWTQIGIMKRPWILAGGIGLHNLESALAYQPDGIDISSGAETEGKKDREKIKELIAYIRKGQTK